MHALIRGAALVALLSLLDGPRVRPRAAGARSGAAEPSPLGSPATSSSPSAALTPCGPGALPLGKGRRDCVPLPQGPAGALRIPGGGRGELRGARDRWLAATPGAAPHLHTELDQDVVPRLPDRPEKYADYQLPIDPVHHVTAASDSSASGPRLEIDTDRGAPVTLTDLEHQAGRPTVLLVGELHGITVIVQHHLAHPGGSREVLVIYGNLARPGPRIVNGATLDPMAVIGYVGGDEGGATLYLEVRQLRAPLSRPAEHLSQIVSSGVSVAVDPRNVLPLRK